MRNSIHEISELDFNGKKWITKLRNLICENGKLNQEQISSICDLILCEDEFNAPPNITDTTETNLDEQSELLYTLSGNTSVNGLKDDQEIYFSPFFTLLFGYNGAGKSSYYKILKDAFHSDQPIRKNIYKSDQQDTSALLRFTNGDEYRIHQRKGTIVNFPKSAYTHDWTPGARQNRSIKFCDREILDNSLNYRETGWTLDQYKISYYKYFQDAINEIDDFVKEEIEVNEALYKNSIYKILYNLKCSGEKSIYQKLNDETDLSMIEQILKETLDLTLSHNHDELKERLTIDSVTSYQDLKEKIELDNATIDLASELKEYLQNIISLISNTDLISDLIEKKKSLEQARDFSAFDKYKLLFELNDEETSPDKYLNLLKTITETALYYGFEQYPKNTEKCFYCNQELPDESKQLIENLHKQADSEHQKELDDVIDRIEEFKSTCSQIEPFSKSIKIRYALPHFDISSKQEIDINSLITSKIQINTLDLIKRHLFSKQDYENQLESIFTDLNYCWVILNNEKRIAEQNKEILNSRLSKLEEDRKRAKTRLNELTDKEYLIKNRDTVLKTIEYINNFASYSFEREKFRTYRKRISDSKTNFEGEEVWSDYREIFKDYLDKFNLSIKENIKRNFKNPSSVTHIDSTIRVGDNEYQTSDILSEGEAKVHALCDFLTESKFDNINTLVFDDPITSLDQRHINKFCDIVTEMSRSRQIIIFTHSLELYQKLVTKTLGNKSVTKSGCQICLNETNNKCMGDKNDSGIIYKCGNYYQIEKVLQPGHVSDEIDFQRLSYDQRLDIIKEKLISGDPTDIPNYIRTTINNFYEEFFLSQIRKQVFVGEDLIHQKDNLRIHRLETDDYNELMRLHNLMSSSSTIHDSDYQTTTKLDTHALIEAYNSFVNVVQKYRSDVGELIKLN